MFAKNTTLEDYYVNIGTEKSCFFIPMSRHLIKIIERYPLLYYAVEEGVVCAKNGYYAGGIIVFAQILKQFSKTEAPQERHDVAHRILLLTPNKINYDNVKNQLKNTALSVRNAELQKIADKNVYNQELEQRWREIDKPPPVETDAE